MRNAIRTVFAAGIVAACASTSQNITSSPAIRPAVFGPSSSFDDLENMSGATWTGHRLADNAANRCASVPAGSRIAPNGKTIQWTSVARMREVATICRREFDAIESVVRSQHPERVRAYESHKAVALPIIEADANSFVVRAISVVPDDPKVGCWVMEHVLLELASYCVAPYPFPAGRMPIP